MQSSQDKRFAALAQTGNRHATIPRLRKFNSRMVSDFRVKPATLAVIVQIIALLGVLSVSWLMPAVVSPILSFSTLQLVLLQATLAAAVAKVFGMARWWFGIHFCLPVAMYVMSNFAIPAEVYLGCFILTLTLFWTTFRSQVPFFPSFPAVWKQVATLLPHAHSVRLIDIGSGLGDMPMYIAKMRPDSHIEGIEIAPLPWALSYARAKIAQSKVVFKLGDYTTLDFANYDVVFAYLSPAAMQALWTKASQEMRSGSMLISLEFDVPGVKPTMQLETGANAGSGAPTLYVWQF